jgi:hypothetical protein
MKAAAKRKGAKNYIVHAKLHTIKRALFTKWYFYKLSAEPRKDASQIPRIDLGPPKLIFTDKEKPMIAADGVILGY